MNKIDCQPLNVLDIHEIWRNNIDNCKHPGVRLCGKRLTIEQYAYFIVRHKLNLSFLPLLFENQHIEKQHNTITKIPLIQYILNRYIVNNKISFKKKDYKLRCIYTIFSQLD